MKICIAKCHLLNYTIPIALSLIPESAGHPDHE